MNDNIMGIHHITAMSGDPQTTVDFYVGLLGLRMVKQTVNYDDPGTYHLYFGDEIGSPGSLVTFFPWGSSGLNGRHGTGQVSTMSLSIPEGSVDFWMKRLKDKLAIRGPWDRFDEEGISFEDPDGLRVELVATSQTAAQTETPPVGPVPTEHAIRGIYGVELAVEGYERTAGMLTEVLGFRTAGEKGNRFRYIVGDGGPGRTVDVVCEPDLRLGQMGVGTVHHIAWRTPAEAIQQNIRNNLVDLNVNVTPVLNRNYFKSIYFREPGHILFEVATDPPGMLIDESRETLGQALKLPAWLEKERAEIERILPALTLTKESV